MTLNKRQAMKGLQKIEQLAAQGRHESALSEFNALAPDLPVDNEVQTATGRLCLKMHEFHLAIVNFSELVERQPDNAVYLGLLGQSYREANEPETAVAYLTQALSHDAKLFQALADLGLSYLTLGKNEEAEKYLSRALEQRPKDVMLTETLMLCLHAQGRHEDALVLAGDAGKGGKLSTTGHDALALIYTEIGDMERAEKHIREILRLDPRHGGGYASLSRIHKFSDPQDPLITKMESALSKSLPVGHRSSIHFALGKAYDDCKDADRAFANFRMGNRLEKERCKGHLSTASERRRLLKVMQAVFSKNRMESLAVAGSDSEQPVFVVGMPRSGTTLIEQIIASHARASGAGELSAMSKIAESIGGPSHYRGAVAHWGNAMTPDNLQRWSSEYLEALRSGRGDAARIVDKMPENFNLIGLIRVLFPEARIIHIMRHPLDTCLSCYFQRFQWLTWSFDFSDIALRYRSYRQTVSMWKTRVPSSRFTEIQYEALIDDPEPNVRRLIDFIGLDWDPACLKHSEQSRLVVTASAWQARQPIYTGSKQRWRAYAPQLAELASGIYEYLDDADREEFARQGVKLKPGIRRFWPRAAA